MMPKPKGAGVSDELRLTIKNAPVVRVTNMTQEQLKHLILVHIKKLPEMKGFKILTAREDDGIQFIVSISGRGHKDGGRQPELMIVHFETVNAKTSKLVVPKEMWARIEALRFAIMEIPQLKPLELNVWDRAYLTDYDLTDDFPPRKFALTIEYYPEAQGKLEKRMAAIGRQIRVNIIGNVLRAALKTSEIKERIKQCVKK
jgi:hypothetical protein